MKKLTKNFSISALVLMFGLLASFTSQAQSDTPGDGAIDYKDIFIEGHVACAVVDSLKVVSGTGCMPTGATSVDVEIKAVGLANATFRLWDQEGADGATLLDLKKAKSDSTFRVLTYTATAAGTYTLWVSQQATGCDESDRSPVTFTVYQVPGIDNTGISVSGTATYCEGSTFNVTLSGSQNTSQIQYFLEHKAVGSSTFNPVTNAGIHTGNGSGHTWTGLTNAGTYQVVARTTCNGVSAVVPGTAVVTIDPKADTYTISQNVFSCVDGSNFGVLLPSSQNGYTYKIYKVGETGEKGSWTSTGNGVAHTFTLNTTGDYYIEALNQGVCAGTVEQMNTIAVTGYPLPVIPNSIATITTCVGSSVTIDPTGGGGDVSTYRWYTTADPNNTTTTGPDALDKTFNAPAGTTHYYVAAVSSNLCVGPRRTITVVGNPLPLPPSHSSTLEICHDATTATLSLTNLTNDGEYRVYDQATNGTLLTSGTGNLTVSVPGASRVVHIERENGNNCISGSRTEVTITKNTAPQVFELQHLGLYAYCENTSLRLSDSETGVTYQLFRNGSLINTRAGDGDTLVWNNISQGGLYKVEASKGSCTAVPMTNELDMIVDQVIPYNVTGGGTSCELDGSQINLSSSQSGLDYYLVKDGKVELASLKSGTGSGINWTGIKTSGDYGVAAFTNGCGYVDMNLTVAVDVTPVPLEPVVPELVVYQSGANDYLEASYPDPNATVSFNWYQSNGTFMHTGNRNNLTNITGSQTYLVESVINGCPGARVKAYVTFTLAAPPTAPSHVTACEEHYLQRNGNAPTDVIWYWQGTDSNGKDKSLDAAKYDYRIVKDGTYYLRAYDKENRMWGPTSTSIGPIDLTDPSRIIPVSCDDILATHLDSIPDRYDADGLYNYVSSYDVLRPGMTEAQILSETDNRNVMLTTAYADGIGRSLQTVARGAAPNGKDMVQMAYYDGYGRETSQYLPFTATDANGTIKVDPFEDQKDFYAGNTAANITAHFPDEQVFNGRIVIENSPLNRPLISMAAGDAWAGTGVGISNGYNVNVYADSVRIWTIGGGGVPVSGSADIYATGDLAVGTVKDEDGKITIQYTDKLGQVILKKVQRDDGEALGHADWLNTYYVYDDFGNLRFVMPPRAVEILASANWLWNVSVMNELVFRYTYDNRARMITKQVPGAGEVYMVYDLLDRLVLTQDANQRDLNLHPTAQWSFTKYDKLGRPVTTGFYHSALNQDSLQNTVDEWDKEMAVSKTLPDTVGVVEGAIITLAAHVEGTTKYHAEEKIVFLPGFTTDENFQTEIGGTLSTDYTSMMGYQDATFPLLKDADYELLTLSYHDDYDFTERSFQTVNPGFHTEQANDPLNAEAVTQYPHVMGVATGSRVKVLGSEDDWLTTVMYYDERGRVVQTQGDLHTGGESVNTSQYDFSGKALLSYQQHKNTAAGTEGETDILSKQVYTANGRLAALLQKLNSNSQFDTLVTHVYNDLGELETKKLGASPANPLETLDFDYNVRGWLKGVNRAYVAGTVTDRFFGMDMSYEAGYTKNNRNGNISGIQWKTRSSDANRSFGYDYDASNRILKSDYGQDGGVESNWSNALVDFSGLFNYDANGNILALARNGVVAGTTMLIDDLAYDYGAGYETAAGSNQLKAVQDASVDAATGGFLDNNTTNTDYAYDANGNMTLDHNKGITAISYNHLNLPQTVTFTGGRSISYTYDAAGIKLSKLTNDNGVNTTTDYAGGFIYENNALQHFAHSEGRVRKNNAGGLVYDYFIKDHLGNTRMTLTADVDSTIYLATMETDVTPGGLNLQTYEEGLFLNLATTRDATLTLANHTSETGINNNETARLNGFNADRRVGPAKLLAVSPGDEVAMQVFAYHQGGYVSNDSIGQSSLATALAAAFGGVNGSGNSESQAIYDLFNQNAALAYVGGDADPNKPLAYLNYIQFDQDFDYVDAGFVQVLDSANTHHELNIQKTIDKGGYIYMYLSAESQTDFNVYFDDFRVTHTKGAILQEDHYYPFGLSINALSSSAPLSTPNHFKYNGFEEQTDFDLGWYDYDARNYDPQLGRWFNVDPAADLMRRHSPYNYAFDNPIRFIDPDGMIPTEGDTTKNNSRASSEQALVTAPPPVAPSIGPGIGRGLGILGGLWYFVSGQAAADAMGNSGSPSDEVDATPNPYGPGSATKKDLEEDKDYVYRAMAPDPYNPDSPRLPVNPDPIKVVSKDLGVRHRDMQAGLINPDGSVSPGHKKGGMSATPTRVQKNLVILSDLVKGKSVLWRIKRSELASRGLVADDDKPDHVSIQPGSRMSINVYQEAIASTKHKWKLYVPGKK